MPHLILAQSEATARSLGVWLEVLGESPLVTGGEQIDDERALWSRGLSNDRAEFVAAFRELTRRLRRVLEDEPSTGGLVFVDVIDTLELNIVGSRKPWERLVALLILAFPEVRWVFGVSADEGKPPWWEARHGLSSLFGPDYDPLFDGTELRAHILDRTAGHEETGDGGKRHRVAPWIPQRKHWCAAIDDEAVYAYLHAYKAYRHGFRAFAVHTQALGDHLLKDGKECWKLDAPHLTLEDYYLGFPDKEPGLHLSLLEKRSEHWPMLDRAKLRHFITSGQALGRHGETVRENRRYRRGLRAEKRGGKLGTKPVPGIITMWKRLGLKRTLRDRDENVVMKEGLAPRFKWPPKHGSVPEDGETSGHSAPGLLLLVAESLIERADAMVDSVKDVKGAVRGAVLATSALELIGPRTPTTAREALDLKHRFETLAECQFGGIHYNLRPEERFPEIEKELSLIAKWHGAKERSFALLNGQLTIISRLMRTYSDHEEFDEAEKCRKKIRRLNRKVWLKSAPETWAFARYLVYPFRVYAEWLIGSMSWFAIMLVIWWLGIGAAVFVAFDRSDGEDVFRIWNTAGLEEGQFRLETEPDSFGLVLRRDDLTAEWEELGPTWEELKHDHFPRCRNLAACLQLSFGTILGDDLPEYEVHGGNGWVNCLLALAKASGLFHLGIFFAHLYTLISRR